MRISNFFSRLTKAIIGPSYDERMEAFLAQASSREHLEQLERIWFSQYRR